MLPAPLGDFVVLEPLPDMPLLPLAPLLPEAPVLPVEPVLPELEDPALPEDPVELDPDLLKCWSHSERDTCPSLFLSTDEKLGAELPEALLPPRLLLLSLLDPVLAEPEALLLPLVPEDPLLLAPCEVDGLLAEEPLLLDLSPAAQAALAKPTNAAVTAALISFNVM